MDPQGWWRQGACWSSYDLRSHAQSPKLRSAFRAEYCLNCVVRDKCRDFADMTDEKSGVWGGVTRSKR